MIEDIGWIGSILLACCGLPEAILAVKRGHCRGMSWYFLGMWGIGEILACIYTYLRLSWNPLLFNYAGNLLFIGIMVYYKIWERV